MNNKKIEILILKANQDKMDIINSISECSLQILKNKADIEIIDNEIDNLKKANQKSDITTEMTSAGKISQKASILETNYHKLNHLKIEKNQKEKTINSLENKLASKKMEFFKTEQLIRALIKKQN
jgi:uncharacterized coiled-coil protein SlyX